MKMGIPLGHVNLARALSNDKNNHHLQQVHIDQTLDHNKGRHIAPEEKAINFSKQLMPLTKVFHSWSRKPSLFSRQDKMS